MLTCRLAAFCALWVGATLAGCSSISYYSQSLNGHLAILRAARPIDDVLADAATSSSLKTQLKKIQQIRAFAAHELGLPDNASYKSYVDLGRPFVVWNVFAAPRFSMKLKQWCYPVTGCVTYRGYYSKDEADAYAASLRLEAWDVQVSGVPAYSTLGLTADPVLSSFVSQPELEVARLIFHELAHQVVYVQGDTRFNESFASAVEEEGLRRWLLQRNDAALNEADRLQALRRKSYIDLLNRYHLHLENLYQISADETWLRAEKQRQFNALKTEYAQMKSEPGSALFQYIGYDRFFAQDLNNAHLAAVATYTQWVPAYAKLLRAQAGDLSAFYRAVKQLAALPPDERHSALLAFDKTDE